MHGYGEDKRHIFATFLSERSNNVRYVKSLKLTVCTQLCMTSQQSVTTECTTGVQSPAETKDFFSSLYVPTSSEAHSASYPMGARGPFPGGKARSERDADHSPNPEAMSRMITSYISSPPCRVHGGSGTALLPSTQIAQMFIKN
jgi:hypothetical protein